MFLFTACSLLIASSAEESFQLLQSTNVRDEVEIGLNGVVQPMTKTDEKAVESLLKLGATSGAKTDKEEAELLKKIQKDGSLDKQTKDIQKNKAVVQGAANQLGLTGDLTKGVLVTAGLIAKVDNVSVNSIEKDTPPESPSDLLLSQTLLSNEELKAEMAFNLPTPWPNGKYSYCLDGSQNGAAKSAITAAIKHLRESTPCVSFHEVKCSAPEHKAKFITSGGCWSYVGKVTFQGNYQQISIGRGCEWMGTVAHEILHSLGKFHEQSRDDRDNYVKILFGNIQLGKESNFKKHGGSALSGTTYDRGSIMHYGGTAFTKNGRPTITDLNDVAVKSNRQALSAHDKNWVNVVYKNSCTTPVPSPPTPPTPPTPPAPPAPVTTTASPITPGKHDYSKELEKYCTNKIHRSPYWRDPTEGSAKLCKDSCDADTTCRGFTVYARRRKSGFNYNSCYPHRSTCNKRTSRSHGIVYLKKALVKATTLPPATTAPGTLPPATNAPGTLPPATNAPGTLPPATNAPGTNPPTATTKAPTTGTNSLKRGDTLFPGDLITSSNGLCMFGLDQGGEFGLMQKQCSKQHESMNPGQPASKLEFDKSDGKIWLTTAFSKYAVWPSGNMGDAKEVVINDKCQVVVLDGAGKTMDTWGRECK